jgi:GT2 family glycosyltransferase
VKSDLISVIIPTYKDWDRLAKCLEALQNQSLPSENFEVIVVNNDSNDSTPSQFPFFQNVQIYFESAAGSYAARNRGVEESSGTYLAFTDSDYIPAVDWLANGLCHLKNGSEIIGGKIEFFQENEQDSRLAHEFEKAFSFNQKINIAKGKFSVTANLMTSKKVFLDVGTFRSDSYSGGDVEWCLRANSRGYHINYFEDLGISHPSRKSIESLVLKKRRTSGGYFYLTFQQKKMAAKLVDILYHLRPPLKVLKMRFNSREIKLELFILKWYLEWVGVMELIKLAITRKVPERS